MDVTDFLGLSRPQQNALVAAMLIRNALEDFHVAHLSDQQMAELNPLIRHALFDYFTLISHEESEWVGKEMAYLVSRIPEYWEIPDRPSDWLQEGLDERN